MAAAPRSGRPSPAERRRRRTRTLALVVAIALVATLAIPLAALAAPARPGATGVAAAPGGDDAGAVLGTQDVHEVWLWSTAFLRGDAGALAEPLESADQWVAGAAGGTRTAWRDPEQDRVVLAASDDDAELADALGGLPAGDRLVTDEGDWLVLAADGTVRALLPDRLGEGPGTPTALADFQASRAARWQAVLAADDGGEEALAGGAGSPGGAAEPGLLRSAVPWAVLVALTLTGTAVAVRTRREQGRRDAGAQAAVGSTSPRSS